MNILTKATVLVLNRNWQAINVRTPQEAFCMVATNVATGFGTQTMKQIARDAVGEEVTSPSRRPGGFTPQDSLPRLLQLHACALV
jgi:hypothetical protein